MAVEFPTSLMASYWSWVEPLSVRMINRRTRKAQPSHDPFDLVSPFLSAGGEVDNPLLPASKSDGGDCNNSDMPLGNV